MDVLLAIIIIAWAIRSKSKKAQGGRKQRNKNGGLKGFLEIFKQPEKTSPPQQSVEETQAEEEYQQPSYYSVEEEACPYEESRFHTEYHTNAYEDKKADASLTELEKGIVFAEILSKPVSMRKR